MTRFTRFLQTWFVKKKRRFELKPCSNLALWIRARGPNSQSKVCPQTKVFVRHMTRFRFEFRPWSEMHFTKQVCPQTKVFGRHMTRFRFEFRPWSEITFHKARFVLRPGLCTSSDPKFTDCSDRRFVISQTWFESYQPIRMQHWVEIIYARLILSK